VLTPTERAPGLWVFAGCFASPGNTFYDVLIETRLPDGRSQMARVLDHSDPTRNSTFQFEVQTVAVVGVTARIYFNTSRR
jgi:hypothetical protein